ncbi:hypothetical protein CYMTET_39693 [Cymbomonas tetramitiformis]|uniref:Uncharacterized protein n=1 Tax=Cymbomonas tetramitiformis TaxID=36881 RepID=A0AAE0CAS5_9CHLO|nr:hypothetical protein CYMTET_39693 [Cymbomonas tetramitiformis]
MASVTPCCGRPMKSTLTTTTRFQGKGATSEDNLVNKDTSLSPVVIWLGSVIQASMKHVAYCTITVLWLIFAWALFTYAMLIREMMSPDIQDEFFTLWAVAFGLGLFGWETMQVIFIQIFASLVGDKLHMLFEDIDPPMLWFEKFVLSKISPEDNDVDDNENDDDAGDQDMGDDADAFG